MITFTRIGLKRCNFQCDTKRERVIIDSVLKFWVDGAIFSDKFRKGHWDGYFKFYDKNQDFDYGLLFELVFIVERNKLKYEYIDNFERLSISDKIEIQIQKGYEERNYQTEAVKAFFEDNIGIIVVPTRGGKTFITSQCIIQINKIFPDYNSILYVDSIDLFSQSVSEISKFLGVPESEIGKINSDNFILKKFTVAMVQTVTTIYSKRNKDRKKLRLLNKHLRSIKFQAVDEIQDNSSDSRLNIYSKSVNAEFILGLSATPFKQMDVKAAFKVKGYFGDICYEVKKKRLQKEGYLSLDKAVLISNDSEAVGIAESYNEFLKLYIHENKKRNNILLKVIEICEKNKWKTLFLFNSKQHGRLIEKLSGKIFIDGDNNKKERTEEKEKFLQEDGGILLASNIFKKGITLPEVEICVIADGGLEGTALQQKFGRMLGTTKKKKRSLVMDIMDVGNKYFSEHSLNRLEVYESEIGKKRIEIYDGDTDWLDIEESIKEWLHVNK